MELSQLAAKQKRARDWQHYIESGDTSDPHIIQATRELLVEFRSALATAAQQATISSELEAKITNLERKLEQLNEDARLRAGPLSA